MPQFAVGHQAEEIGGALSIIDLWTWILFSDQIYHLLTISRSQGFNLTSLFVDERKGDIEPNLTQLPTPQPYYQNGYGNDQQPPPGGRFSPAGYNNWNTPTSNKPPDYPGLQPDRWRQVDQPPGNGGTLSPGTVSRNSYVNTSARQSRTQDLSSNQRTLNSGRNPSVPQLEKFNYNERRTVNNQRNEGNFMNNGYNGVTQFNRMDPNSRNVPFENPQQFDNRNFTRYFTPNSQNPQEPFQIQPPVVQQRIKGRNSQSGQTTKPSMTGNWKGAPSFSDYSNFAVGEQSRFIGRRDRRNEDVEVACEVRSTYVPPRAALSDNSEWKYVVNVPERDSRFTQVVRVDICLNAGQPCSSRLSLPFGFESRCRQKYIKKKLLSLNSDGQGTSEDNFFIPSCCVCEITRNTEKK
ncbi:uncharacterized protein [Parasteatoda tepidariorum]|uniref:uncharacterized protein isoform X2 n=1 Tax=Parasteatoda tepidariorum TaxID=114398 RepID=UPI00077FC90F|nr:uncharacterized protein LOC107456996 isoform X2 [Parasteatoda tepidariorum]